MCDNVKKSTVTKLSFDQFLLCMRHQQFRICIASHLLNIAARRLDYQNNTVVVTLQLWIAIAGEQRVSRIHSFSYLISTVPYVCYIKRYMLRGLCKITEK